MVDAKLIAAADGHVITQRMQTEAVDEFEPELLDAVCFAIKDLDEFAVGFLVVPEADHVFLAGKGGKDGPLEADVHGIDFSLVEAIVEIVEDIALDDLAAAFRFLRLQQGLKGSSGDGAVVECDCYLLLKRAHRYAYHSSSVLLAYLPLSRQVACILILEVFLAFLSLHPQREEASA